MKTVKRKANVGERILITNRDTKEDRYQNGDILSVTADGEDYRVYSDGVLIFTEEYEVIIEEANEMPNGIIEQMQAEINELKTKVAALEAPNLNCRHTIKPKSPQQIRDEIVAKAKADVENMLGTVKFTFLFTGKNIQVLAHFDQSEEQYETLDEVKFVVNPEKRTVVSLAYYRGRVVLRGIAKADPSDCFNVHLGKAIALRRALGLEVPAEYYNAPAPTEVRVGDLIKFDGLSEVTYEVMSTENKPENLRIVADGDYGYLNMVGELASGEDFEQATIIDDSREVADK